MIPCPWRFSTVSSFGELPTKQGRGIVSPLHLKVIYGQKKGDEIIRGKAKSQDTPASENSDSQESRDSSGNRPEERLLIILNPLPHKFGDTNLFLAPLEFQGGKGGLMSIIKSPKTCLRKLNTIQGDYKVGRPFPFPLLT